MVKTIYSDNYLLVLDKPPGLVVTSSETQTEQSLEDILKSDYDIPVERGGIVHRLDKDTSGVLVVAKTREALENLQSQFKERVIHKEYVTLVHGLVSEGGRVEGAIARNPGNREKFVVFEQGEKEAVTEYSPVGKFQIPNSKFQIIFESFNKIQMKKLTRMDYNQFTLLRCHPLTGRTHQIRVHLKYIGFPIVGDNKYGGRKTSRLDKRWCPRQFLHAAKLELKHPESGERMVFQSPLPEDLEKVLNFLEEVK